MTDLCYRIRFAPPLVIEETDLHNAIKIIEQSLNDLDEVSLCFSPYSLSHYNFSSSLFLARTLLRRKSQLWTSDYGAASGSALIHIILLYTVGSPAARIKFG